MKRAFISLLAFFLLLASLCSCAEKRASLSEPSANPQETSAEKEKEEAPLLEKKGTRKNPYQLGEEIKLSTTSYDQNLGLYTVDYTITFTEFWGSEKVKQVYGQWSFDDRILVRGSMTVSCDKTSDEIFLGLNPNFITDKLNEEWASFYSYKGNDSLDGIMYVYSGGTYSFMILGMNDGIGSMTVPYLKLNFSNESSQSDRVWLALPSSSSS